MVSIAVAAAAAAADDGDDDDDDDDVALVFFFASVFVGFILPFFLCASDELLGSPGGRKARIAFIFRKPSTSGHLRIKSAHSREFSGGHQLQSGL